MSDPGHGLYDSPACRALRGGASGRAVQGSYLRAAFERGAARPALRNPALCGDAEACLDAARSTWQRVQEVANEFDQSGRFTALIEYEFSALLRDFGMLHRKRRGPSPRRSRRAIGNAAATSALLERAHIVVGPIRKTNSSGLAGVWAESNTRAHLFDAVRRRETFATSGSRLRIRFFAGDLPADVGSGHDDVARGYASGVPMGSDLVDVANPRFWVWAVQDPAGPTLDRIQVVKGWIEDGEQRHEVRDIVCSGSREPDETERCAPTAATVDLSNCQRSDETGAAELQTTFSDPSFDADQAAFYYVRVLENPQCRWTTHLANAAGLTPPSDVPAMAQQRGWSSPIWVSGNQESKSR